MSNEHQSQMKACFDALKLNASNNKIPFYNEAYVLKVSVEEYFAECPTSTIYSKDIPIKVIDGIPVDITLFVKKYKTYMSLILDIEAENVQIAVVDSDGGRDDAKVKLYNDTLFHDHNSNSFTIEQFMDALKKLHDIFQKIYFSKYHGMFLLKETTAQMGCSFWDKIIGDNAKIEKKYANCCVCMEGTLSKTKCCSQSLCIECFGNIKPVRCMSCQDEDDECNETCCGDRPCPLCRKSLNSGQNM